RSRRDAACDRAHRACRPPRAAADSRGRLRRVPGEADRAAGARPRRGPNGRGAGNKKQTRRHPPVLRRGYPGAIKEDSMRFWIWLAGGITAFIVTGHTDVAARADHRPTTTTTPIEHVVVIFQENVSFDHYFATYPFAANTPGEPPFVAANRTPTVNGLTAGLLTSNPNGFNPFRLDRTQAATCDQDHDYTAEQLAFDAGLMDKFPPFAGVGAPGCPDYGFGKNLVMGYFDGNTVTALWNYAQRFAMNDNSYGTTFGPSTPGAINLVSGQTHGAMPADLAGDTVDGTIISDPQPTGDACTTRDNVAMATGQNVGDLLNAKGITWGFFQGGFDLTATNPNGSTGCARSHTSAVTGVKKGDYIPPHEPSQYYASTANPTHARPSSVAMVGRTDAANHQYDLTDFFAAASRGNLPAVSFLKAAGYQDGHAGYSRPLAHQTFLVNTINSLH